MENKIADAFYNEDYKELEKLTGIKATSQIEFERKFEEKKFEDKILDDDVDNLTLKEIDSYIDENFDIWASKFELSPCGQLTLKGKKEYIENNLSEVKRLVKFNRENPKNE